MERVLKLMFWSRFRLVATSVLCTAGILAGSAVVGRRAMGLQWPKPDTTKGQSRSSIADGGVPLGPAVPASQQSTQLTANEQARLDLAKKIRDAMLKRFSGGEIGIIEFLQWQKRYSDIVGEVAKTDVDRLRHYESQVVIMKQLENSIREIYRKGMASETDMLVAELERLEAEGALEKFQTAIKNRSAEEKVKR
jgi:hypothetical protein